MAYVVKLENPANGRVAVREVWDCLRYLALRESGYKVTIARASLARRAGWRF